MAIYVLDTDSLSLYGRDHPKILALMQANSEQLATTAITVEEQVRGRLAQIAEARTKNSEALTNAYQRLVETVMLLSEFPILQYNADARTIY